MLLLSCCSPCRSPYFWASLGVAIAIGMSVLGAAWGIFITGSSLVGAAIRAPRITSKNLISVIFCEAAAIYGVIVAIILQTKIEYVPQFADGSWPVPAMTAGYSILGAGIACGFSNLYCGCVGALEQGRMHINTACLLEGHCVQAGHPPLGLRRLPAAHDIARPSAGCAWVLWAAAAPYLTPRMRPCLLRSWSWRSLARPWVSLA